MLRNLTKVEMFALLISAGVVSLAAISVAGFIGFSILSRQTEPVVDTTQVPPALDVQNRMPVSPTVEQQVNEPEVKEPVEAANESVSSPDVGGAVLAQSQSDPQEVVNCSIPLGVDRRSNKNCKRYEEHSSCGETYSIYLEDGLEITDPVRRYLAIIPEAMNDACQIYNPLFELSTGRDVNIVVDPATPSAEVFPDSNFVAIGWVRWTPLDTACVMVLPQEYFRIRTEQQAKQVLAHELFHCKQHVLGGKGVFRNKYINDWWIEGGAEYFSNVVYPMVNNEYIRATTFDIKSNEDDGSITTMSYEAWLFFQYLANQKSHEWIIDMLYSITQADQQSSLRAFIDQDFFHEFGKAYWDKEIKDTGEGLGGLPIPTNPSAGRFVDITGSAGDSIDTTLEASPFEVRRYSFIHLPGKVYRHSFKSPYVDGVVSFKEVANNSNWGNLPEEIVTDCENPRALNVLITTTGPADMSVQIETEITDNEECTEPSPLDSSCSVSNQDAACLVGGTWTADLSQWLPYYVADASPDDVNVIGTRTLKFNPNGTAIYSDSGHKIARGSCGNDGCDGVEISMEVPEAVVSYEVVNGNFLTSVPTAIQGEVTVTLVGGNNDSQGKSTPLTTESLRGPFGTTPAFEKQGAGVVHGLFLCTPKKLIICAPEGFYSVPRETTYTR